MYVSFGRLKKDGKEHRASRLPIQLSLAFLAPRQAVKLTSSIRNHFVARSYSALYFPRRLVSCVGRTGCQTPIYGLHLSADPQSLLTTKIGISPNTGFGGNEKKNVLS